ncbi:hypothetical protein GO298_03658 [Ralstonia solanacearum]|nr:hypothetical protein [Ralstonia solanacearum]
MPRSRRCRWHCAKSYRLSAWSLLGRHRGRPVSPGTLGMASTRASNTTESWRLAPVTLSAKGTPRRSTARWRLLSSLPRSVGFGPVCLLAPGGLATVALSMLARPQSIWSCSRRRLSSAKCSRSQTPSACQSRKRRQHVIPLPKPNSFGRSSHGIPVCKTNRMPFSAARSPARGWPPLAEGFTTGSSGCRTFHNALLIFFQAMSPKTSMDRCQMTWLFRNYKTSLAVEGLPRRIDQHRPYD